MFRRSPADSESASPAPSTPEGAAERQGKGRPTPSRREAEAAARERAKASRGGPGGRAGRKVDRAHRGEESRRIREGFRNGEERYLPARDRGPERRTTRDLVDSRLSMGELLMPGLLVSMLLTYSGQPTLAGIASGLLIAVIILTAIDSALLVRRVKRQLRAKYGDDVELRGIGRYAATRTIQTRLLRMPKPQVRIGGQPKRPRGRS